MLPWLVPLPATERLFVVFFGHCAADLQPFRFKRAGYWAAARFMSPGHSRLWPLIQLPGHSRLWLIQLPAHGGARALALAARHPEAPVLDRDIGRAARGDPAHSGRAVCMVRRSA